MKLELRTHIDGSFSYFDQSNQRQGETKDYFGNTLRNHGFYKDDARHGEFRIYNHSGSLRESRYYDNGKVVLWSGTKSLPKQKKMLMKLKYGGEFLKE